jgi:D-3-phosphoglycerate dehydrogenase / 2-oxoglutarate reductase
MTPERLLVFPDADPDLLDQLRDARGLLAGIGELRVFVGRPSSAEEYRHRIAGASALLLGWELPTDVLEATHSLEAISFLGSGVSTFVDLEASARAGITVMNVPRYGDTAVAEHALALILASIRKVVEYDRSVKEGAWGLTGLSRELQTTTLGILGLGGIGRQVARLASGLGMRVVAWTRSGRPGEVRDGTRLDALDSVLSESDVVSLHLPLVRDTAGILSAARLARMRPGSILINTARAELVDEEALIEALEHGPLAGAALDVLWKEPPPANHRLLRLTNVVVTPHVAFATREASERMLSTAIENLVGYFRGEPPHVVNSATGATR